MTEGGRAALHRRPGRKTRARTYEPFRVLAAEPEEGTRGVYVYLRLSSYHNDLADAIERQRIDINDGLVAPGHCTVLGEYIDNDSASSYARQERAGWRALNEAINDGRVKELFIWKYDRGERVAWKLLEFLDRCARNGVKVRSLRDPESFAEKLDAGARVLAAIKAALAEWETDTQSERMRAKKAQTSKAGFNHGGQVPFGWRLGEVETDALGRTGRRLAAHPVEHPALRAAVAQVLSGKSVGSVARFWQDEFGIVASNGGPVQQANILRYLRSPRLLGYRMRMVPAFERGAKVNLMDHVERDDAGEPLVVMEPVCTLPEWTRLQAVLTERSNVDVRRPWGSHEWLLSGLLRCGSCGGRMYGSQKRQRDGQTTFVYRCISKRNKTPTSCTGMSIAGPKAELFVVGFALAACRSFQAPASTGVPRQGDAEALELARAELAVLAERRRAGYFQGRRLDEYFELRDEVQARIEAEERREQTALSSPRAGELVTLADRWDHLDLDQRRELLRHVIADAQVRPSAAKRFDSGRIKLTLAEPLAPGT